jgi:DNA polymerase-3 subunit alpha
MFGEDWGSRSGYFSVGASVYVTGKIQSRYKFKDDGPKDLKVTGVEYLQTIKDKAVDRITIQLTTDLLDDQIVAELGEMVSEHPGKTKLFFQLRDSLGKHHVLLKSKTCTVDVHHQLIDYIERNEALDYKIN